MQTETQNISGKPDEKETQEIIEIMQKYFLKATGSKEKANQLINETAKLIQQPAAKLVHIGDSVFLLLVKDKGVVEFHTMRAENDSVAMAKELKQLADYCKQIGVQKVYTYSDLPQFKAVAKRTRLPVEITEQQGADGKDYTVYTLQLGQA